MHLGVNSTLQLHGSPSPQCRQIEHLAPGFLLNAPHACSIKKACGRRRPPVLWCNTRLNHPWKRLKWPADIRQAATLWQVTA